VKILKAMKADAKALNKPKVPRGFSGASKLWPLLGGLMLGSADTALIFTMDNTIAPTHKMASDSSNAFFLNILIPHKNIGFLVYNLICNIIIEDNYRKLLNFSGS
jgi:hypothetical protein